MKLSEAIARLENLSTDKIMNDHHHVAMLFDVIYQQQRMIADAGKAAMNMMLSFNNGSYTDAVRFGKELSEALSPDQPLEDL